MVKKLTNNLGMKILAVMVACVVWLIVINYADPIVSVRYSNVPVTFENQSSLTEKGMVYEVLNASDTVDVVVYGKRSVLETLSYENIHAVADLEDITIMNTVAIQVSSNKSNDQLDSIRQSRTVVELAVENRKEVPLTVNVVANGTPSEGYIIGDITQNQNSVRVSGPESVIDQIVKAECAVSVTGRTSDLSTSADIRLYDADGKVITHHNMSMNISSINVGVEILPSKAVDIVYHYTGEPAEGYVVTGEPSADRTAVYIAGRNAVLNKVERIVIPESVLDISGREESLNTTINLKDYLPDGIRLVQTDDSEEFDGKINILVEIEELVEQTFSIPIENLRVENVPDGYKAEVLLETEEGEEAPARNLNLQIKVRGVADSYVNVVPRELQGVLDVAAYMDKAGTGHLADGVYRMEVKMELPEGLEAVDKYYADVRITSPAAETETQE